MAVYICYIHTYGSILYKVRHDEKSVGIKEDLVLDLSQTVS